MSRKIQVFKSSSSEASTSDDGDSDYESSNDSVSTNDSNSSSHSIHVFPSTSEVKRIAITVNSDSNCIQEYLRFKPLLSTNNTTTRAKKRQKKNKKTPAETKKQRTRAVVSAATNWNCGACDFSCVSIELLREHVETSHVQSKGICYECKLCLSLEKSLYSHYGKYHVIDFTENLLFNDGTVLVFSSVNTNDGKADWFVKQKEIAELRLTGHKCRLCEFETDFENEQRLKHHYTAYHKVHLKCLDIVKFLFRMEKNAHLEKNTVKNNRAGNASTVKAETPNKSKNESKTIIREIPDSVPLIDLIMYVCKCGVAKETYDASVEHAQKHLASDYKPNTQKCTHCDLTFESASFVDHSARHHEEDTNVEVFKKLEYDFSRLLSNDWFNLFIVLEKSHIAKIMASTLYKYTRSVKLHWDSNTGIPLYQCGVCHLIVEPAKVDNHSENYGACINFGPKNLDCTICRVSFSTAKALKIHKDDHEIHGNNGAFRFVIFNNRNDMQFNKALKMKQYGLNSSEADSQDPNDYVVENARIQETNELVKKVDARVAKLCSHGNQCILEYGDHIAGVENEKTKKAALKEMEDSRGIINEYDTAGKDDEQGDSQNSIPENNDGQNEDNVNIIDVDAGNSVLPWDSDSDSCDGGEPFITTQAQIHIDVNDYERLSKRVLDRAR